MGIRGKFPLSFFLFGDKMGFNEFIRKTLTNKRGYKYHTYQTEYKDEIFSLYHYNTLILKVDLKNKEILFYRIYSFSDSQAISETLWELHLGYYIYKRKITKWIDENTKIIYKSEFGETKKYVCLKCEKLIHQDRILVLNYSGKVFILFLKEIDDYIKTWCKNLRKFWLMINGEEKILANRDLNYIAKVWVLEKDNLLFYLTNSQNILEKAYKKLLVNEI